MNPYKKLLIHRCTLIGQGEVVGQDDYGRDIVKESKVEVNCRFDEVRQTTARDDTGTDFIFVNYLYFDSDIAISLESEVENIKDQNGFVILPGRYSISRLVPIYRGSNLHHWEAIIQRM